jgi:AAA domain-containing protein
MLIFGEPGAGKTWFCGTAEDHKATSPVLLVDMEGGVLTLRKRKGVDVVQARTIKELTDVINRVYEDKSGYYRTFVLDSLTELQKRDMREVMDTEYNKKPDTTDRDVASQRSWGKNAERVRRIIRALRDLPMNSIVTSLAVTEKDEQTGIVRTYPSFPGKMRGEVPGYFDVVGLLYAQEERNGEVITRRLQVAPSRRVLAKDRTSALGQVLENPTVPMLWDLMAKDGNERT